MASPNAHAIFANGIRGWRPSDERDVIAPASPTQPHVDLLDAEADLQSAIESCDLLYRPFLALTSGMYLHVDADVVRQLVLVTLVEINANGDILKNHDRVTLRGIAEVEAAVQRVRSLAIEAAKWATDMFAAIKAAA